MRAPSLHQQCLAPALGGYPTSMPQSSRAHDRKSGSTRSEHTREGGGGTPVPADDLRDESLEGEDATAKAEKATPPTEGPAAAGALPG
jgi:hypothetical protein